MNGVRDPSALTDRTFDVLVVGGGALGAGVARDAALRGMSVALVEQDDFASGTTSRSTRLIHGGLRYLEHRQFGLVRENLRERELLMRLAPHLVQALPVHVPLYRPSVARRAKLRAGMLLYDLLSRGKKLPRRRWIGREQLLALEPGLRPDGLRGAWRFYDARCALVERLVVENVVDATAHGAVSLNHAKVVRWLREGDAVTGAEVEDRIGGTRLTVRARESVNATGPWLDRSGLGGKPLLRLTKGVHLVTPPATKLAHLLFASDGRPFFVIPWLGSTLVGTTDTDFDDEPSEARADADDTAYLIESAKAAFPQAPFERVHYAMAGVRALIRIEGVAEGKVPREHEIRDHSTTDGVNGIVSMVGGKLTAYRSIAQEATDLVAKRLGNKARPLTKTQPLPGAADVADLVRRLEKEGIADAERLARTYGARAHRALDLRAEAALAAEEGAATLADFLLRRSCLGLAPDRALPLVDRAADALAEALSWSDARRADEVATYREEVGAPLPTLVTA